MKKSILREYVESLVVAVILALFVRTWVLQAFKIPSGSMEKGLLVGDHLIVNKMTFAPTATAFERAILPARGLKRGDVVVFKAPEQPDRDLIKRVIGLPGDTLELHRKVVYINGQPLDELRYVHYMEPPSTGGAPRLDDRREEYGPVTVPAHQYFMMGDNRDNSEDSRYWGFMPESYVKGQALFLYFSLGDAATPGGIGGVRWNRLLNRVR
ncbi:MAG: signal peptidase I [Vicinamibacterales bacterium]